MRAMLARLAWLWCYYMHSRISWPVCGQYVCFECMRRHRVTWDEPQPAMLRHKRHTWQPEAIADDGAVLVRKDAR
jgi:hypothetical protein